MKNAYHEMGSLARRLFQNSFLWPPLRAAKDVLDGVLWCLTGNPIPPPPIIKRRLVTRTGALYGCRTLVETGTFLGDMAFAQRHKYFQIISIELQPELFTRATARLKRYPNIQILEGDSSTVLPAILETLPGPVLFWLDAHYSGGITAKGPLETPIHAELSTILSQSNLHRVILIDDARCFDGSSDYPTLNQLRHQVSQHPEFEMTVAEDIIRILPRTPPATMPGN
jgi:hypothetical protein